MLTLLIDRQPAILDTHTQFTLTRENPLFTGAGTYTLEITLPLAQCPQNTKIFGPIQHLQARPEQLQRRRLPFQLIAPPLNIKGTTRITQITQTHIKIQLLAERSQLNDNTRNPEIYIDQIPLQPCWHQLYQQYSGTPNTPQNYQNTLQLLTSGTIPPDTLQQALYGTPQQTQTIALPIYSIPDQRIANQLATRHYYPHTINPYNPDTPPTYTTHGPLPQTDQPLTTTPQNHTPTPAPDYIIAPQPYLLPLTLQIFRYLGYTHIQHPFQNTTAQEIIIANTRPTIHPQQTLPHWTIQEYITELQNLLSVIIDTPTPDTLIITPKSHTISLTHQTVNHPRHTSHQHQTTINHTHHKNETDNNNPLAQNIAYTTRTGIGPTRQLTDKILQQTTIRYTTAQFPTPQDLKRPLHNRQGTTPRPILYITPDGWQYAFFDYTGTTQQNLQPINHLAPATPLDPPPTITQTPIETDYTPPTTPTTLKIIPALHILAPSGHPILHYTTQQNLKPTEKTPQQTTTPYPLLAATDHITPPPTDQTPTPTWYQLLQTDQNPDNPNNNNNEPHTPSLFGQPQKGKTRPHPYGQKNQTPQETPPHPDYIEIALHHNHTITLPLNPAERTTNRPPLHIPTAIGTPLYYLQGTVRTALPDFRLHINSQGKPPHPQLAQIQSNITQPWQPPTQSDGTPMPPLTTTHTYTTPDGTPRIDTHTTIEITIHTRQNIDPKQLYHIDNKIYICRQLQYTLTNQGTQPTIRATLHPLDPLP